MYSFGAMLSFTVAHASIIALRVRRPGRGDRLPGAAEPPRPRRRLAALRDPRRDRDRPRLARHRRPGAGHPVGRPRLARARLRRLRGLPAAVRARAARCETVRAPAIVLGPSLELEYRTIVVPVVRTAESEEALVAAARLAADRRRDGRRSSTCSRCRSSCRSTRDLPDEEPRPNDLLDEARALVEAYGVRVVTRLVRARRAGPAIVEEAVQPPRRAHRRRRPRGGSPRGRAPIFGRTVDHVLKSSPCRVLLAAGRQGRLTPAPRSARRSCSRRCLVVLGVVARSCETARRRRRDSATSSAALLVLAGRRPAVRS